MTHTKPNFFIVGAPKCGTTAWVEYLNSHPGICFSEKKEPHYFNTDFPDFRWAHSIEEYLDLFSACGGAKIVGEASVQYLYSEKASENIADFAPRAKILIFLRSPGAFIRSYHNQLLLNADECEFDLRTAWEMSGIRDARTIPASCREARFLDYKKVGLFSEQVQRYVGQFPPSHVKVVLFDHWIASPRRTYLEVMDFLGLQDDGRREFRQVHGARRFVSSRMHQLSQRPPMVLKPLLEAIRKIPGMRGFRPAKLIRSFNIRSGYPQEKDEKLENEIDRFFAEDQAKLYTILSKISRGR